MEKKAAAGRIVVLEATEDSLFEARRRSAEDVMTASIGVQYCVVDVSLQKKTDVTRSTLDRFALSSAPCFGFYSPANPIILLPVEFYLFIR